MENPIVDIEQAIKTARLRRLEKIFIEKVDGLVGLGVQQDWTKDKDVLNAQKVVYDLLSDGAKIGAFDTTLNKAIVKNNKAVKKMLANVTLLFNEIKKKLVYLIETDDKSVDKSLDIADNFHLSVEDISDEESVTNVITNIKKEFGV